MSYRITELTPHPFSETALEILTAFLSEAGYDSFEQTESSLKAYIQEDNYSEDTLRSILDSIFIQDTTFTFNTEQMEEKDWNETWEQNSFDPVLEREFGIKLNPKMAFGSGSHDTTHTIVSLLMGEDFSGQRVLDMGTGTGVLGIAMAKQGARQVVAIDIDPFSVTNAKENFALNNINNVEILLGDATAIEGTFSTIVANIHKNILTADLATYTSHLSSDGKVFLSGFFTSDVPDMKKVIEGNGLSVLKIAEQNDWAVIIAQQTKTND